LNILLLSIAFVAALTFVNRELAASAHSSLTLLSVVIVLFGACVAWRDSTTLKVLDVIAILSLLITVTLQHSWSRLRATSLFEYFVGAVVTGFQCAIGAAMLVIGDIHWKEIPRTGWSGTALASIRGIAIATPIVLVFGALLVSADAAFENLVTRVFSFDVENVVSHIFLACVLSWIAAGLLRASFFEPPQRTVPLTRPSFVALGFVEIAIILVALDLLFAVFVALQITYLFGGEAYAKSTVGLTFAQYYRRGFFELVAVAALVLLLQLSLHWLLRKEDPRHERWFRIIACIQIGLVAVIMLSAVQRLFVYITGYGLTELRLYTTAFLSWIGIVFAWYTATVLRGRRESFASGAVASAFAVALVLNIINPDAIIVRTNLDRVSSDGTFDASYATTLSADAVPTLVDAIPLLGFHDRSDVAREILRTRDSLNSPDLGAWSLSRWLARNAIDANAGMLQSSDTGIVPSIAPPIPTRRYE